MSNRAGATATAQRGTKRHAATEQALREAWQRLRTGTPIQPELIGRHGQLSISAICLEAGCSRNALYNGHPQLLEEIRAAIAAQRHVAGDTRYRMKRSGLEASLAQCRADWHRLVSENAALLLRAVTAEEALARLKRRMLRPIKMKDDTP